MEEKVNHPSHYNTNNPQIVFRDANKQPHLAIVECIDVIRNMPTWKGNAIKYLWRCGLKKEAGMTDTEKELEDLNKAMWYIQDRINQIKV